MNPISSTTSNPSESHNKKVFICIPIRGSYDKPRTVPTIVQSYSSTRSPTVLQITFPSQKPSLVNPLKPSKNPTDRSFQHTDLKKHQCIRSLYQPRYYPKSQVYYNNWILSQVQLVIQASLIIKRFSSVFPSGGVMINLELYQLLYKVIAQPDPQLFCKSLSHPRSLVW